jgi:DNA-binding transcriptional LysR family regulator
MQTPKERRVPSSEHVLQPQLPQLPDWEGAHMYLELIRKGSFRAAADHLGLSVNALRVRITDLERFLGVPLVTRHVDGIRPTAEGQEAFDMISQMEQTSFELIHKCSRSERTLTGAVRLAVTEGIGSAWIGAKLVEFQRANPKLMLEMNCAMRSADVLRLETDVSVQLMRPTAKEVRVVKLGRLHLCFFAAQSYLDTYGEPLNVADLRNHRLVVQADDDPSWHQLYNQLFPGIPPHELVTLRTNVSSANYSSVVTGAGFGMLPTYVYALGAPVVPLGLPIHHHVDIWMTCHADAPRIPRVRQLMNWLTRAFSPKTYPWFRDEYIAPLELPKLYSGQPLRNPFEGVVNVQRKAG